jgi:HlyD family secretion protein
MDREIPQQEQDSRTRRRVLIGGSAGVAVVLGLFLLPGMLRPGVERSSLRFAKVERGAVAATVSAAGTVLPAFEQAVSSPVEARVVRILKHPGEAVHSGEPLVELDTAGSRLELGRLDDRLAAKRNDEEQARLDLESQVATLQGRLKSQRLDAEVFAYKAAQSKKLRAEGLVSDEALKAAEVAAQKATIDAEQLEADIATAKKTSALKLAGLALDLATLRRERDEAAHELELATAKADRDGVVTWTVLQEGTTVRRGDVLARVAGLESFRVEATVSDVHSARLRPGLAARVLVDGQTLAGTLTGIYPTIENGAVRFRIDLAEPKNPRLRNNLRVDVQVETGASADGLKLHRGPGIAGGEQEVYVVHGNRAERRLARFGISGVDDVEVVAGLAEGDEVVISNLEQYRGVSVLKLR